MRRWIEVGEGGVRHVVRPAPVGDERMESSLRFRWLRVLRKIHRGRPTPTTQTAKKQWARMTHTQGVHVLTPKVEEH